VPRSTAAEGGGLASPRNTVQGRALALPGNTVESKSLADLKKPQ